MRNSRPIPYVLLCSVALAACGGGEPARRSGGSGGSESPEEAPGGTGGKPAGGGGGSSGSGGSRGSADAASSGSGGVAGSGSGGLAGSEGGGSPDAGGVALLPDAGGADLPPALDVKSSSADPKAPCPRCVQIFNGMNFDGWEAGASTWTIVGGAIRGVGGSSRAAYTKADYGNVRLFVTSRMNPQNGDHLGILFWGNRPADPNRPQIDNAGWVQWMPPFGTMWSYHPPMHHFLASMKIATSPAKSTDWHTSELLLNLDKGTLRVAVDGLETTRYTHAWPTERVDPTKRIIKGPIGMMRHGGGASEYKDIWVEVDPTEDKLYSVK